MTCFFKLYPSKVYYEQIISFFVPVSRFEQILMIVVCLLAVIVELINTAIEAVVDRISIEQHPLSKIAKDMGSAAQFFALVIIVLTWGMCLIPA